MKTLFISNDPSIFQEGSPARARMRAYAKEIGELHIISKGPREAKLHAETNTSKRSDLSEQHEDLENDSSLTLHPVTGRKPFIFFRMRGLAHALILKEGIEIVSAQDPFEYGWVAMRAVKGTTAKLHIQIHTDPFSPWFTRGKIFRSTDVHMPFINKIRQRLADKVLPRADGVRVVSKRIQESLVKRYGARVVPSTIIPIAVSADVPPRVELPPHPFTFALISVGRLEPEKRVQDTLMALARIHRLYPRVGLFVVGEGSQRKELEKYAAKLGVSAIVQFLGHQDNAWGLMQSAQAYIQSSGYEGYSRTLLEAALARTPIITTDVGIVGEVFKGYEDALAVPPGDPAGLSTAVVGLVEDNEARKEFSLNAERAAREHLASVHTTPADISQDLRNTLSREIKGPTFN